MSVIFPPAILGPEKAEPILWAPGSLVLSARKPASPQNSFLRVGFGRRGGSVNYLYGRGDFLVKTAIQIYKHESSRLHSPLNCQTEFVCFEACSWVVVSGLQWPRTFGSDWFCKSTLQVLWFGCSVLEGAQILNASSSEEAALQPFLAAQMLRRPSYNLEKHHSLIAAYSFFAHARNRAHASSTALLRFIGQEHLGEP